MRWLNPWYFNWLLLVLFVAGWFYIRRHSRRPSLQFSHIRLFKELPRGVRARWVFLPPVLKLISCILMVVALARPQASSTRVKRDVEGIDIMIVLDISDSMLIEDMAPNRIEAAKRTIKEFIDQRVSDRIGLIIFSGESYTRVPLTLDYKLLLNSLAAVETSRTLKMGTAIGVALANGVARLRESTAKSRVLVFLTDGESNSGSIAPETALEIAKGYDIRIYSIGMGIDGQAQLPIYSKDAFGNTMKVYQPIHSKVNDELLNLMAESTGGKYYRATNTKMMENVFLNINRLEKTKVEINQYTRYTELFPPYVHWALLFYAMSFITGRGILRRVP